MGKRVTKVTLMYNNSRSSCCPGERLDYQSPEAQSKSLRAGAQTSAEGRDPAAAKCLRTCQGLVLRVPKETGDHNQLLLSDDGHCWGDARGQQENREEKDPFWSFLVAQWVKDPALSLQWLGLLL